MKLDQLRTIIREEVRAAVKEELQDVINEAVKIASAPVQEVTTYAEYKPVVSKPTRQELAEIMGLQPPPKATNLNFSADPLQEMLEMTKRGMSGEDYRNVISIDSTAVQKPNFASSMASQMGMNAPENMPGLDISQLSFVKKAKQVLDLANEKSNTRL